MEFSDRYLAKTIKSDAFKKFKMAFISGPRQVGKTTLAKTFMSSPANYFSYDQELFRRMWSKDPSSAIASRAPGPVILDEIHKDRLWKRRLKGIYDSEPKSGPYIVTGSARLDVYRKGGDSLLGRYLPYRLHPFTLGESADPLGPDSFLAGVPNKLCSLEDLLNYGTFPEPLLNGNANEAQRWSRLRLERLVNEDTRDILNVSDLRAFQVLAELLPERVGSLLSINSLREDVGKAYATVRSWYQILETLYFSFTVRPYSKKITRANRAEPKMFLFDILQIPEDQLSKRLENLTALHLLKMCHFWTDTAQGDFQLHFVKDKSGKEVDFLVTTKGKPWLLVECKSGSTSPSSNLLYYSKLLAVPFKIQLVTQSNYFREFADSGVKIMGYDLFFSHLP